MSIAGIVVADRPTTRGRYSSKEEEEVEEAGLAS